MRVMRHGCSIWTHDEIFSVSFSLGNMMSSTSIVVTEGHHLQKKKKKPCVRFFCFVLFFDNQHSCVSCQLIMQTWHGKWRRQRAEAAS